MSAEAWFSLAFILLMLDAVAGAILGKRIRRAGYVNLAAVTVAGGILLCLAGRVLAGETLDFTFPEFQLAGIAALPAFRMDALSALFTVLISLLAIASALYTIGYLPFYRQEDPRRYYVPFPLFIAGMVAVVNVSDLLFFLVFWEFMTLASYFLVVFESASPENLKAGYLYFFITHISSAGLILATMILSAGTGSFSFQALPGVFRDLAAHQPGLLHVVLAMFFIGFGTKAGMYPFGIWLPEAHPAAPASISALLSGVMIKMGVYGLLRMFWMVPASSVTSWGGVIAFFGTLSMIVGNLRALGESDSKRLLAQSSIGQMGYILLGIGIGFLFLEEAPLLSMIGFVGALYHVINHACFKSLLFFNTGSLLFRTGTRDLNRMGGLISILPATAVCGLAGGLSIAGMPPFNGFMSKWLIYQGAIFGGLRLPLLALAGVIAIFMSTVSLAAYVKYFGTAFLGSLPDRLDSDVRGVPFSMEGVEAALAVLCVTLGLFPALPFTVLYGVVYSFSGGTPAPLQDAAGSLAWGGVGIQTEGAALSGAIPLAVLAALLLGVGISFGIYRLSRVKVQPAPVWNCGEALRPEETRGRAAGFYLIFTRYFDFLYRRRDWPKRQVPVFLAAALDFDRWIYFPIGKGFLRCCQGVSRMHCGLAHAYLVWQIIGVGLLLGGLFWMTGG